MIHAKLRLHSEISSYIKSYLFLNLASNSIPINNNQNHSSYSSSETILISDNDNNEDFKKTKQKETTKLNTANQLNSKKSLKINVMRDLKSAQKLKNTISNTKYSQFASPNNFNDFVSKSFTSTPANSQSYHRELKKDFLNNSHGTYSSYDKQHDHLEKNNENTEPAHNIISESEFDYSSNSKRNQHVNSSTLPRNSNKSRNVISNIQVSSKCKNNYSSEGGSEFLLNKNNDSPTESQASFYNDKHFKYSDINGKPNY